MTQDGAHKAPKFHGTNFTFWKVRMEGYLTSLGFGFWNSVRDGYTYPPTPTDVIYINLFEKNGKERNAIMSRLENS